MKSNKGKIVWHDLTVPNVEEVRDFYATVLGWTVEPVSQGDYYDYNMVIEDKPEAGIIRKQGVNASLPACWMMYISVDNLSESLETVKASGGTILEVRSRQDNSPMLAFIQDPAGAVFALFETQD